MDQQWERRLKDFNQPLLRPDIIESYVEAIYRKGSALNNGSLLMEPQDHVQGLGVTKG